MARQGHWMKKPDCPNKKVAPASRPRQLSWQGRQSLNGTLEDRVKKSDAELTAIEEEIREIRELDE
jgi:hypothetical protein